MSDSTTQTQTESPSLTLVPNGDREVVTFERAIEIVDAWTTMLQAHNNDSNNSNTPLIHKINLSDKSYTLPAAKHIAEFLTSTSTYDPPLISSIQIAHLNDTIAGRMEDEGLQVLKTLSDMFIACPNLKEVDLSDNAMGSKGVSQCMAVLGKNRSLERLSLCNNGLSEYSMNEIADLLTAELDNHYNNDNNNDTKISKDNTSFCIAQNLTQLHFFNNMSGNEGCKAFQRILNKCSSKLTNIRFSSTRARREGSAYITQSLANFTSSSFNITHLDLCDNSFADCYTNLALALKQCTNLQFLNLKDCILSNDGVAAICNSIIQANPVSSLHTIHFSGNDIDADGAKSVAKLVKKFHNTIQVLDLEDNEMTSIGIKRILVKSTTGTNTTSNNDLGLPMLKTLLLSQNEIGRVGANALMEVVDKIPRLEHITLDCNNFSDEIVEQLMEVFGDKLQEMEDNYGEEEEEEEEEEEGEEESEEEEDEEGEEEKKNEDTTNVDELIAALSNTGI